MAIAVLIHTIFRKNMKKMATATVWTVAIVGASALVVGGCMEELDNLHKKTHCQAYSTPGNQK